MATIVTRLGKGSPLSTAELDANFTNLNTSKAELNSPTFTGIPAAPNAAVDTNTTQLATTAFVLSQASAVNPLMNGVVAIGTSTRFARADHVHPIDTTRAPVANPTFTGTVTIPAGAVISGYAPLATPTFTTAWALNGSSNTATLVMSSTVATLTLGGAGPNLDFNIVTMGNGVVKMNGAPLVSSVAGKNGVVSLVKADVGLGNVDNTSDINKPVSTATQTALNLKAPLASPTFTGTVSGITKAMVGLGNVDNTSDINKPVSTATQTALSFKADAASPTISTGATFTALAGSLFTLNVDAAGSTGGLQINTKGQSSYSVYNNAGAVPLLVANSAGATSTAYLTLTSGNTGNGVTLAASSYGAVETNVDINLSPLGTGAVNLNDKVVRQALFKDFGLVMYDSGVSGALDYRNGSYQRWAPTGTVSFSVTNWPPTGNYASLVVKGVNLGAATISFPAYNWIKGDGTLVSTYAGAGYVLQSSGVDFILLWTDDAGATIYAKIVR